MSDSSVMVFPVPVGICTGAKSMLDVGPQSGLIAQVIALVCPACTWATHADMAPCDAAARNSLMHLEQAVALGVQRALELQHVAVLLWVDVLVWKVHFQALQRELRAGDAFWWSGRGSESLLCN